MPFVMFTLALVQNYHVHLIRADDELAGLDWRWHPHVQNLKLMYELCYPEDSL